MGTNYNSNLVSHELYLCFGVIFATLSFMHHMDEKLYDSCSGWDCLRTSKAVFIPLDNKCSIVLLFVN